MPRTKFWTPALRLCGNRKCRREFLPKTQKQTCCTPECGKAVRERAMRLNFAGGKS